MSKFNSETNFLYQFLKGNSNFIPLKPYKVIFSMRIQILYFKAMQSYLYVYFLVFIYYLCKSLGGEERKTWCTEANRLFRSSTLLCFLENRFFCMCCKDKFNFKLIFRSITQKRTNRCDLLKKQWAPHNGSWAAPACHCSVHLFILWECHISKNT